MAKKILQFIQGIIVEVYDLLLTERKDYHRLSITTQFSTAAQSLKEPRSCVLDYALSV